MEIEWGEGPASTCVGTVRRSTADDTHSAGCSTEAPGCIGARGLRDGCAGLLPPPWSRQSSPAVPGLRLGREEDEDIVGWEYGQPRETGGDSHPRNDRGRP